MSLVDSMFEERILHRLRFAAQSRVSREFLHDTAFRTWPDEIADQLVMTMEKNVLVDKVLDDQAAVPVRGTICTTDLPRSVLVELPRPWWRRLLRRPARSVWCPVVGNVAITGDPDTVPVAGTATVRAEYFRTFPEATFDYPPGLGAMRVLVRTGDPFAWTPEVSRAAS